MTAATIFTAFAQAADDAADRQALCAPRLSLSFRQLHAEIRLRAGELLGWGESGPVALLENDARRLLVSFFACAAAGRPALILDPARPLEENRRLAARHGASLLLGHPLPSAAPAALPAVVSEAEFYWGLTSGTTGEPKLFARSHRSWLESFAAAERVFPFPPAAEVFIPGPLSHSLFLYGAVHALCRGHAVITPSAFRPDRTAAAACEADCVWVVPAMLAQMLDHGLAGAKPGLIFCGGAKLSPELRQRCEIALPGTDLVEFYGASETSFITYAATSAPAPAGSVGRPFPGVRIDIRGDDRQIHVASPMLFAGYVGGPAAGEWFTAGDTGFLDADGFLHLTGRVGRIINSRALKIRPEPIEAALLELPGVARAAVIDLPDGRRGAIAAAVLQFVAGERLARRIVSEHCRSRLGTRFAPQRYYEADSLPLTRSGKIALASLREALMAENPAFRALR